MRKARLLVAVTLLMIEAPKTANAQPPSDKGNTLQACRVIHQEDESVVVTDCMQFLQTSGKVVDTDWPPPFCRALAYYEPELFYSVYTSVADCIAHNKQG